MAQLVKNTVLPTPPYLKDLKETASEPAYVLGGGYSSDRQMPTLVPCINTGPKIYNGDSKSVIYFGDSRSFEEFQKDLNVEVSESGSIGLFSEDISASYARHVKNTAYTESFYYSEKIDLPTEIVYPAGLREKALNEFGKSAYQEGPDDFRSICGDQVILQNHLGAGLHVSLKVHFNSIDDKNTFTANAGAKYGNMLSVSGKIAQVVSEHQIKGEIEVSALQVGGDASQLGKIFTSGPNPYAITSCSLDNMTACQNTINGVLAYAAGEFPNQINFQNGKVLGSAASQGYTFMPLSDLKLNTGNSTLTPEIEAARKQLGDLYLHTQNEHVFINHILESPIFNSFYNDVKEELKETNNALISNTKLLDNLDSGAMRCYNHPKQCIETLNNINNKSLPVDEFFIYQIKNSYNFGVDVYNCVEGFNIPKHCRTAASAASIAMPTDKDGHFQWDYLGNNNSFTLLENNDGSISLTINGGQYPRTPYTTPGVYEIPHARCLNINDPIPHPLNTYCHDSSNPMFLEWGEAYMGFLSVEDVY